MATWRRLALELFPQYRRDPEYSYYMLYFDLLPLSREAHRNNDRATLRNIYGFAEWCLRQQHRAKDLGNAVYVAFYEHLFDEREDWERVIPYLTREVFEECWSL